MQCVVGIKTEEAWGAGGTKMWRVKKGFPETKDLSNNDCYVSPLCKVIHNDLHLRRR